MTDNDVVAVAIPHGGRNYTVLVEDHVADIKKSISLVAANIGGMITVARAPGHVGTTFNGFQAIITPTITRIAQVIASSQSAQIPSYVFADFNVHFNLETQVHRFDSMVGVTECADDLGTFTGSTFPDNSNSKDVLQIIETALETP